MNEPKCIRFNLILQTMFKKLVHTSVIIDLTAIVFKKKKRKDLGV